MGELPEQYQEAIRNMYRGSDGVVNEDLVNKVIAIANRDPIGFMSGFGVNEDGRLVNLRSGGVVMRFDERALNSGMLSAIEQLGTYPVQDKGVELLEASVQGDPQHGLAVNAHGGQTAVREV